MNFKQFLNESTSDDLKPNVPAENKATHYIELRLDCDDFVSDSGRKFSTSKVYKILRDENVNDAGEDLNKKYPNVVLLKDIKTNKKTNEYYAFITGSKKDLEAYAKDIDLFYQDYNIRSL